MDALTAIAAVVAIGLSLAALLISRHLQGRANDLQARIVTIEEAREADRLADEQKALVVATTYLMGKNLASWGVSLVNNGRAEARDVQVVLDGKPIADWPNNNPHPPTVLGPTGSFEYLLEPPAFNQPYPTVVEITWTDDSGTGRWQTAVNVTK